MKQVGQRFAVKQRRPIVSPVAQASRRLAASGPSVVRSPAVSAQSERFASTFGAAIQTKAANETGLPEKLKSGVEILSGVSMDSVRVHYNSAKPAQLGAHAFAQGRDIHVAPGQQRHLPHEAWHVVQQSQGRVRATRQLKGSIAINDDRALEKEADTMGSKALRMGATQRVESRVSGGLIGADDRGLKSPSSHVGSQSARQLETKMWSLTTVLVVKGEKKRLPVEIEYDDEKGLLVGEIKQKLIEKYSEYKYVDIVLNSMGSNTEQDGKLKEDTTLVSPELIKLDIMQRGGKIIAVVQVKESKEELEEALKPKEREPLFIKQADLVKLIEAHSFKKVVTGNHINAAIEKTNQRDAGVTEQQVLEIDGSTLFIDSLFEAPGKEWQYHDQLFAEGRHKVTFDGKYNLYVIETENFKLGILKRHLYSDELREIDGPAIKEYIVQNRPANIKKE